MGSMAGEIGEPNSAVRSASEITYEAEAEAISANRIPFLSTIIVFEENQGVWQKDRW